MLAPYLLIPVSLGVLLSYFFSHLLVWFGVISKKNHRKFWNIILLITFFVTAILGLLLVVQINFKLEWAVIDTFLSWHVNFGIALSLVAVIHFLWHFDYYLKLFKKPKTGKASVVGTTEPKPEPFRDDYLVILIGFTATILQVLLLRELTTIFQGNEIMMTWTIGVWMVLTGTGSLIGSRFTIKGNLKDIIHRILFVVGIVPVCLLVLLILLKNLIFLPGVLIRPGLFITMVTIVLSPVCILTGLLFTLFIRGDSKAEKSYIRIYLLESLGSIIGGVLVSFLFINWFSVLQSLILVTIIICTSIYWRSRRRIFLWISLVFLSSVILLMIYPFELKLRSALYSGNEVILDRETYFGNLAVTGSADEYNVFLNGSLLFNTGNFIRREEFVHYAMLQHKNPETVLIVSGGVAGMTSEILKYPSIKRIDYLEINRQLIKMAKYLDLLPDTTILHIAHSDINRYISTSHNTYDVVILALPDPTSVQLNRYYSNEFIGYLKTKLNAKVVLICGLSSSGNYISHWQNARLSLLYNTLSENFKYIEIIPGDKDYFLASDIPLSYQISKLSAERGIENEYVNQDYIDDNSFKQRGDLIKGQITRDIGINTNERALPAFYSTLRYLSHFQSHVNLLLVLPLLLLIILLLSFKREARGMYLAGFTGASVEVLLIFVFQIVFGYIYAAIGILISLFMTGLVLGAYLGQKLSLTLRNYRICFLLIICYLAMLYIFLSISYSTISQIILWPVFIILMLIPSMLTGLVFVISSSLFQSNANQTAPVIYAVDLVGSSLGMIITTIVLIPVIGLGNTSILLIIFNTIPFLLTFRKQVR